MKKLKSVIKQYVKNFLEEKNEFKLSDCFDLSSLTNKQLKYMMTDYRLFVKQRGFGNNVFIVSDDEIINEEATRSLTIEEVKKIV